MRNVIDIIINGNGIREIYTAYHYAKTGKRVVLATDGEYLFREGSECLGCFFDKSSFVADLFDEMGISYRDVENSYCHIPQGEASISCMKLLKSLGVEILFDTVKIGTLNKNDMAYGSVFANKFGIFSIEAKNVIEYPKNDDNYFAFQLSDLHIDGIKTPIKLEDAGDIRNITLNRDSKEKNTAVLTFESDHKNISQAFEKMLWLIDYLKSNNEIFESCVLQKTAYTTTSPNLSQFDVQSLRDIFEKPDTMVINDKSYPLDDYITEDILDESLSFDAYIIKPDVSMAQYKSTSVFVAGAGAGGVCAYMSLKKSGTEDIIVCDRAHLPGGTRTLGMVYAFWNGYQDGFAKENKSDIKRYLKSVLGDTGCRDYTGELLYYVYRLKNDCMYSSYVCGAQRRENRTEGVYVAQNGTLFYIQSKFFIDATGDGDVAVFSGCKYRPSGDIRDGFTQSFSIWGETEQGRLWSQSAFHGDEENISTEKYSEYLRGIYASDSVNSPDGFSPILTVRETRSIDGEYTLTMKDIISERIFDDTVAVSKMYFDAHGNGTSRATYTGLFNVCTTKSDKGPLCVRIPYRALIPRGTQNILVISKAVSATRDAACFVRMNPDIQNTAYSAGKIISYMLKNNIRCTIDGYDENIKNALVEEGILPEWTFANEETSYMDKISEGDMMAVAKATCDKDNLLYLTEKFRNEKDDSIRYLYALSIAGLKSDVSFAYLKEKLQKLIQTPESMHRNSREIMSLVTLLSYVSADNKKCKEDFVPLLRFVAENVTSGGDIDTTGWSIYAASKIHATTIYHYKLILALCYACDENADISLADPMEKLTKKDGIRLTDNSNVFSKHLYIRLLSAAARSGSKNALDELKSYINDEHYFFRSFAKKELEEIKSIPCPVKDEWDLWI